MASDLIERLAQKAKGDRNSVGDLWGDHICAEAADTIASLRTALAIERERADKAEKEAEQARVETGEAMLVIEQQDRDLEAVQGKLESVWNKSASREASLAEAKQVLRPFADAANLAAQRSAKRPHDFAITEDFYAAARFLAQEESRPSPKGGPDHG